MMARQQSKAQKDTVERVMHEYKHGELRAAGKGPKVKSRKQAVAIALHEAGASKYESPKENKENLKKTKAKERRGETAKDETEGKPPRAKSSEANPSKSSSSRAGSSGAKSGRAQASNGGKSKAALYSEAKRRDIPGRSKMSKDQLEKALH